jgi:hypothetical protein
MTTPPLIAASKSAAAEEGSAAAVLLILSPCLSLLIFYFHFLTRCVVAIAAALPLAAVAKFAAHFFSLPLLLCSHFLLFPFDVRLLSAISHRPLARAWRETQLSRRFSAISRSRIRHLYGAGTGNTAFPPHTFSFFLDW